MQALLDLPNPTESASAYACFMTKWKITCVVFEALEKTQDTYGDLLVPIILSKLSITVKHKIIRQHGTTDLNLARYVRPL